MFLALGFWPYLSDDENKPFNEGLVNILNKENILKQYRFSHELQQVSF